MMDSTTSKAYLCDICGAPALYHITALVRVLNGADMTSGQTYDVVSARCAAHPLDKSVLYWLRARHYGAPELIQSFLDGDSQEQADTWDAIKHVAEGNDAQMA
jgi:hypothetical protein